LIDVVVDGKIINDLQKNFDKSNSKFATALKKAINETAKQARKDIANEARVKYTIKNSGFNSAMKISSAKTSNLEAIISTKGNSNSLSKFKTKKNTSESAAYAKVLKSNSLKALGLKSADDNGKDLKAFIVTMSNGHVAVVRRRNQEERSKSSSKKRNSIIEYQSLSIPQMLGNEKSIYGIIEPNIKENLRENINKHVAMMMEGR
jgi:hypothetical protein